MQHEPQVYFLRAPAVGLIKVGRSIDIARRLSEIRLISPVPLELLGFVPGDWSVETAYHQRWAHIRRHGEWFEETPELVLALRRDLLVAAWNGATEEDRQWFLDWIDTPIMDRAA